MKTQLATVALMIAGLSLNAQTPQKKQATVHVKKIENINGVEKVTDSTYTTDDVNMVIAGNQIVTEDIKGENGLVSKTIIIDDHNGKGEPTIKINTGDPKRDAEIEKELMDAQKNGKGVKKIVIKDETSKGGNDEVKITEGDKFDDAEIEKILKEAGVDVNDHKGNKVEKVVIVNSDEHMDKDGKKIEKKYTKVVMVNLDITDASPEDVSRLRNQLGGADNKVEIENMKLYPNPNDGKFNLNFNLKNKGDAEITVYDMQGKQVYNEKLPNFTGEYNKPIDISNNAKGIYFVKIEQGKHTQVKKIALD